jgi:hypothetical protein
VGSESGTGEQERNKTARQDKTSKDKTELRAVACLTESAKRYYLGQGRVKVNFNEHFKNVSGSQNMELKAPHGFGKQGHNFIPVGIHSSILKPRFHGRKSNDRGLYNPHTKIYVPASSFIWSATILNESRRTQSAAASISTFARSP